MLSREILMLTWHLTLALNWKWFWPENEKTVNLKSGAFVVIMLLNEHLTQVHSQKDPWLHFGKSFTLRTYFKARHHKTPKNTLKMCVDHFHLYICLCSGSVFPLFWRILLSRISARRWWTTPYTLPGLVNQSWERPGSWLMSSYSL